MHDFAAESIAALILVDECEIRRPAARQAGTFDRETMTTAHTPGDIVYSGKCAIEAAAADRLSSEGPARVVERSVLDLPRGTTGIRIGDVLTVRASLNQSLVGDRFTVARVLGESSRMTERFELDAATQLPTGTGA